MNIEKKTINRSFTIKKQVKQYEPRDFFASYGLEGNWTDKEEQELSEQLYQKAKNDCEKAVKEYMSEIEKAPKTIQEEIKEGKIKTKDELIKKMKEPF